MLEKKPSWYKSNPNSPDGLWDWERELTAEQRELCQKVYYDEHQQWGIKKFHQIVTQRAEEEGIEPPKRAQIDKYFLRLQESYQLYKQLPLKSSSKPIESSRAGAIVQLDHVILGGMKYNQYLGFMSIIDSYSRFGWCIPMTSLKANNVKEKFEKLMKEDMEHPVTLAICDQGPEFARLDDIAGLKVVKTKAGTPQSNGLAERFNRTIRTALTKNYQTDTNWPSYIQNIVKGYNMTTNRSTGKKPWDLYHDATVQKKPRQRSRSRARATLAKDNTIEIGDQVRLRNDYSSASKLKKGVNKWSAELYTVKAITKGNETRLNQYKLQDSSGKQVKGVYNRSFLQHITGVERAPQRQAITREAITVGASQQEIINRDAPVSTRVLRPRESVTARFD